MNSTPTWQELGCTTITTSMVNLVVKPLAEDFDYEDREPEYVKHGQATSAEEVREELDRNHKF